MLRTTRLGWVQMGVSFGAVGGEPIAAKRGLTNLGSVSPCRYVAY